MLDDERYKKLMINVGMPNSRSLLEALKQCAMEAALIEREECAKLCSNSLDANKIRERTFAFRV